MIEVSPISIGDKIAVGVRVQLPSSPPLVMIIGKKGFVACGFINIDAAEKFDVVAAMISGVRSFDDMLKGEVRAATSKAQSLGIKVGMHGREAARLLL